MLSDPHENDTTIHDTVDAAGCFLKLSSLDERNFFAAMQAAGFPNMSTSPLAGFVYGGLCASSNGGGGGVTLPKFLEAIDTATKTRRLFQTHCCCSTDDDGVGDGITLEGFQDMGIQFLGGGQECMFPAVRAAIQKDPDASVHSSTERVRAMFVRSMLDAEAFGRYNASNTGKMQEAELVAFAFAIQVLCDVFTDICGSEQDGLTRETYPLALKRIGVACLERTFQGQFMDAVFTRTDRDETGIISFAEFVKAGMRLIYPAEHHSYIRTIRGYPGWSELAVPSVDGVVVDRIVELVSSLNTGDVILMQDDKGPMGQFINFSLNTPWSHASIVVKRSPLTGVPNSKTEELLRAFPFRRAAHHFCSPGYCRCFDSSEGDFASSRLIGLGDIGLLESTGEGIHLYDLAHRLLESGTKRWTSMAIARLHDAPGRDDTDKINAFIESVRGGIYTVAKDELKAAISFHHSSNNSNGNSTTPKNAPHHHPLPEGSRGTDDFCASLVQRFYFHMGWVDASRPFNSVMPSDFDVASSEQILAGTEAGTLTTHPVVLLEGQGWLGQLELVLCHDLKAQLPLKLPQKKKQ